MRWSQERECVHLPLPRPLAGRAAAGPPVVRPELAAARPAAAVGHVPGAVPGPVAAGPLLDLHRRRRPARLRGPPPVARQPTAGRALSR